MSARLAVPFLALALAHARAVRLVPRGDAQAEVPSLAEKCVILSFLLESVGDYLLILTCTGCGLEDRYCPQYPACVFNHAFVDATSQYQH